MIRGYRAFLPVLLFGMGLAAGSGPSAWAEQQGDCGHRSITVLYNDSVELEMACEALSEVKFYFRSIGLEFTPRGSLRFSERSASRSAGWKFSHGYFNAPRSEIVFFRESNAEPWGKPWSAAMAASFLRHELAHMAVWEAIRGSPVQLRPEWHEFIAYAIQFDLMAPQLRDNILAAHAGVQPSEDLLAINEFTSRMAPEVFAVTAYKTYLAEGAKAFVSQLLRAEIVPPAFMYPFPTLPGQAPGR